MVDAVLDRPAPRDAVTETIRCNLTVNISGSPASVAANQIAAASVTNTHEQQLEAYHLLRQGVG